MAVRSIIASWILSGFIVATYFGLPHLVGERARSNTPDVETAPKPNTTLQDEPEGTEALRITIPQITFDLPSPRTVSSSAFPDTLSICGSMEISHAPISAENLVISGYKPLISVNGVSLAMAPIEEGCFSSGFGLRGGRLHKGVDFYNPDPVNIYAAGDGIVREKQYRDDYGNTIVLDHGSGVFTRYAHLQSFSDDVRINQTIAANTVIGIMGDTAGYAIPRHLHYEVLTGDWTDQLGSFGLTPFNLYASLSEN